MPFMYANGIKLCICPAENNNKPLYIFLYYIIMFLKYKLYFQQKTLKIKQRYDMIKI